MEECSSSVYLPLGVNFDWFKSEDSLDSLDRHLKTTVVLFDRIVIENGRLHLSAGEDGQGMCQSFPGDSYPDDRTKIKPYTIGSPFGVQFNGQTLFASKSAYSVDVDYLPFFSKATIAEAPYLEWVNYALKPESKKLVDVISDQLKREVVSDQLKPYESYFYSEIVKRYAESAYLSHLLNSPLCLDAITSRIAEQVSKCEQISCRQNEMNYAARSIPMLEIPDFGEWEWQKIKAFRESVAGADFRQFVGSVAAKIREGVTNGLPDSELQRISDMAIGKALASELASRRASTKRLVLSTLLNLIPWGGGASYASEVYATVADSRSWISILGHSRRRK